MKRSVLAAVGLTFACAFGLLIFPTQYRHDRMRIGGSEVPVRIHRVTGHAEYLTMKGWKSAQDPRAPQQQPHTPSAGQQPTAQAVPPPSVSPDNSFKHLLQ
jgi:hypothetical protein